MPLKSPANRPRRRGREVPDGGQSEAPLYQMLVTALKAEILTGIYPVGTQLPSEAALVSRFGVSRHTIREALRQLRDRGLVESRQGVGTIVLGAGGPQHYVHNVNSISDLFDYNVESHYQTANPALVTADEALAAKLGGRKGETWLRIEGLRFPLGQETPICEVEIFVASRFAGVGRLAGKRSGPIYELVEAVYGERITEVEQTIRGYVADERLASVLKLSEPATAIEIRRFYRLLGGEVAEVTFNRYPADRFSFSMALHRVGG
jgi:DNA-binding GntR family transcriptional regulator